MKAAVRGHVDGARLYGLAGAAAEGNSSEHTTKNALSVQNAGPRPDAGAPKVVVLGMMELRLRHSVVLQVARAPPGMALLPAIGLQRRGHAERVADTLPGAALETVTSEVLRWRWAGRKTHEV